MFSEWEKSFGWCVFTLLHHVNYICSKYRNLNLNLILIEMERNKETQHILYYGYIENNGVDLNVYLLARWKSIEFHHWFASHSLCAIVLHSASYDNNAKENNKIENHQNIHFSTPNHTLTVYLTEYSRISIYIYTISFTCFLCSCQTFVSFDVPV